MTGGQTLRRVAAIGAQSENAADVIEDDSDIGQSAREIANFADLGMIERHVVGKAQHGIYLCSSLRKSR
jgi:hypothetical protein